MEKKQAQDFISSIFQSKFDSEQFALLARNLLNNFESRENTYQGGSLWEAYREHINQYRRIGKYTDPNGDALDILIIETKSLSKLDRARTSLRNFVVKHLQTFEKDYALAAFYSKEDGGKDWRFSFVKIEIESEKTDNGKIKARKELTPAKRYSFLVGMYENSYTAQKQLLPLLQNDYSNPTIEDIESAFSIEKVTDEFFEQYKELYLKLSENKALTNVIQIVGIEPVRFTKKLLGQIVFLYFLQKKGWLGVPKNETWGKGEKKYMQKLYDEAANSGKNYFKDYLQYLFYEALAEDRRDTADPVYYRRFDCKIPFLNGGLFEADYDWQKSNIIIPNTLFRNEEKNKAGDKGTGILDVFDRYNFTIKEDEPLEKEVAVDPEMLGKVFENMLEIKDRKNKGAFYTPREIVHYMCQESLINYLDNAVNDYTPAYQPINEYQIHIFGGNTDKKGQHKLEIEHKNIRVPKEDIETLIRKGYLAIENDQRVQAKGKETETYKFQLPEFIRIHADLIDEKLASIKICDPAMGSGAFPVGLLNELVIAQKVLLPHLSKDYLDKKLKVIELKPEEFEQDTDRYIYKVKRHSIQESIYGVDIDASAIDIARLRLWLSLIVDEDDFYTIEALPNLDYKIVQGNSLLSIFNNQVIKIDWTLANNSALKQSNLALYNKLNENIITINQKQKVYFDTDNECKRQLSSEIKLAKVELLQTLFEIRKLNLIEKGIQPELALNKKEAKILEERKLLFNQLGKIIDDLQKIKNDPKLPFDHFDWELDFPEILNLTITGKNYGFDIVIGNPPYVQMQKDHGTIAELLKESKYETYERTGDIYSIFYELGFKLLKKGGTLSFITSSQWMKAAYGKSLRKYFIKQNPIKLLQLGPGVFKHAVVDTNILIAQRKTFENSLKGEIIEKLSDIQNLKDSLLTPMPYVNEDAWVIMNPYKQKIKQILENKGKRLKNWEIEIYRGVLTGYNEAFIINEEKRQELINQDPKSDEIIKPILRGRGIEKYKTEWEGDYIIFIPWHFPLNDDDTISGASKVAEEKFSSDHHSLYEYFLNHKEDLLKRNKEETGIRYEWYAMQRCAATYIDEFKKEKIVWKRIGSQLRFSYSKEEIYCLDSTCIATGEKIKFLTAILNSSISHYQLFESSPKTGMGDLIISVQALEPLFVYYPLANEELIVNQLFDYIYTIKSQQNKQLSNLMLSFFEHLIDSVVFEFYFTGEIKIANKEFIKHLGNLKPITVTMSAELKLAIIQAEFNRLYDPNHPVRNNIETLDSVEEVRIIKEALK
jgi:hypothetical protein